MTLSSHAASTGKLTCRAARFIQSNSGEYDDENVHVRRVENDGIKAVLVVGRNASMKTEHIASRLAQDIGTALMDLDRKVLKVRLISLLKRLFVRKSQREEENVLPQPILPHCCYSTRLTSCPEAFHMKPEHVDKSACNTIIFKVGVRDI